MSPSDIEEYLTAVPFTPLRLTLASGDQIDILRSDRVLMTSMAIHYLLSDDPTARVGKKVRIISLPNIVLVEPILRPPSGGRRRRR
jgi:hypothetical protein